MAKSIQLDEYPPNKNIVRAETALGGWRLKQIRPNMTKATFYSEVDFKVALFIQENVAPKSGHLAQSLKEYLRQEPSSLKEILITLQ